MRLNCAEKRSQPNLVQTFPLSLTRASEKISFCTRVSRERRVSRPLETRKGGNVTKVKGPRLQVTTKNNSKKDNEEGAEERQKEKEARESRRTQSAERRIWDHGDGTLVRPGSRSFPSSRRRIPIPRFACILDHGTDLANRPLGAESDGILDTYRSRISLVPFDAQLPKLIDPDQRDARSSPPSDPDWRSAAFPMCGARTQFSKSPAFS